MPKQTNVSRQVAVENPEIVIDLVELQLRNALDAINGGTVEELMANRQVPGLTIALVHNNEIAATRAFGQRSVSDQTEVGVDTVFQAASLSKVVNAVAILRLVDTGAVTLDEDIRDRMDWSPIIEDGQLSSKMTLKQLLRHSSGIHGAGTTYRDPSGDFNGNGGGYPGYPSWRPVPASTLDILNGAGTLSPSVAKSYNTDSAYSYSGAGVMVSQYALEQITGMSYSRWCTLEVFKPLGMSNSTFNLGPPAGVGLLDGVSDGHIDGAVIDGGRNNYPESAAAGLYTSASDLARLIIMLNRNGKTDGTRFLPRPLITQMMTTYRGSNLGCFPINGTLDGYVHTGSNLGFQTSLYGYPESSAGLIILANGDQTITRANGDRVVRRVDGLIHESVKETFGW